MAVAELMLFMRGEFIYEARVSRDLGWTDLNLYFTLFVQFITVVSVYMPHFSFFAFGERDFSLVGYNFD